MFYKPGNRVGHGHCGLVIYIHNQFNATDITDTVTVEHTAWDYMCLEISHQKPNSKKYLISNIYRLPNEIVQDVNIFTNEFSTYLSLIKNRKRSSFICGDFNINLLLLYCIVLYCIVLYCIMRPYTDGPIGPLSYRHSSGVVRNPHSTLAK